MKQFATAVFFLIVGILLVPVAGLIYLNYGHPPVAVADAAFPMEAAVVHNPLHHRMEAENAGNSPVPVNEATLVEGANVYATQCAFCHGAPNKPSKVGANTYPSVPQLWERHHDGKVVGVSDDPAGETYWKVKNGIRLTGMPSYQKVITNEQMWEVSNLLATADKPMPDAVTKILAEIPQN